MRISGKDLNQYELYYGRDIEVIKQLFWFWVTSVHFDLVQFNIQWEPLNSGIERRFIDSSYDITKSNKDETKQLSWVNRPISLYKLNNILIKLLLFNKMKYT